MEVFAAYDGSMLHDILRVVYAIAAVIFLVTVVYLLRGGNED
jgi:hypothetical protein